MSYLKGAACLFALAFTAHNAIAFSKTTDVTIDWVKPELYKDIDAGSGESKKKYKQRLFNVIGKVFEDEAQKLPNDYKLEVSILDVDLAGEVNHGAGMNSRRIITDTDFPRIMFYMILKDQEGKIVFQGKQNLREKKLKHSSFRMKGSQSHFYMEKDLIQKWFEVALVPAINKDLK